MHLYAITRGHKPDVDRFINDLLAQYCPYKTVNPNASHVQFSVRPIQLWEFVFPRTELDITLQTLKTLQYHKFLNKYALILRKMLKAKKIPPIPEGTKKRLVWNQNIEVMPIGIREDFNDAKTGDELI